MYDAVLVKDAGDLGVVYVRCRYKVFFRLVLSKKWLKILDVAIAEEYLALAVLDILLDIK